ncbi:hypothetical protein ARMGADRAFT_1086295 [Armillaria gallica]|uniref:Uncharacterized protein n=1 Tax=Armillaria gallica TaxID=47427 RepID=A0A2H3CUU4_ARMGA|nr:hypothetical protein ARMGADRAFT_1086295 [Armillaria gallica]
MGGCRRREKARARKSGDVAELIGPLGPTPPLTLTLIVLDGLTSTARTFSRPRQYDRLEHSAQDALNRLSNMANSFFASNLDPPASRSDLFYAIANYSLNMGPGLREDDGCGSAQRDGLWSCRRMGLG